MLTINSIECVVGDVKDTGPAARHVLNHADQSAAFCAERRGMVIRRRWRNSG